MEITIVISIVSVVIAICSLVLSRRDKATKDAQDEQKQFSKNDLIEYRLNKIEQNLEKILNKLDLYDKEIEDKINIAMKHHIAEFHSKEKIK